VRGLAAGDMWRASRGARLGFARRPEQDTGERGVAVERGRLSVARQLTKLVTERRKGTAAPVAVWLAGGGRKGNREGCGQAAAARAGG
jgi:hypothetical protein